MYALIDRLPSTSSTIRGARRGRRSQRGDSISPPVCKPARNVRRFFTIDGRFQTSVKSVWALGDVNGHGAFTHTAYQDGQILLHPPRTVDGRVTLYALYTDPPLGRVGMTMSEARASGRNVLKAEVPMSSVSRAILEGEMQRWSSKSCEQLISELQDLQAYEVVIDSKQFQVEVLIVENNERYVHVMVSVDDGSFPASMLPLSDSFIRRKLPLTDALP